MIILLVFTVPVKLEPPKIKVDVPPFKYTFVSLAEVSFPPP